MPDERNGCNLMSQLSYWDELHRRERLAPFSLKESPFAAKVAAGLRTPHRILELGCGTGADAVYFSKLGHEVVATDGSAEAISASSLRINGSLRFAVQDMREPFAFPDGSFGLVYARLSIHYFSDIETRRIVDEVHRVLGPGGRFFFMCKSVQDPLWGQGVRVGPNMYDLGGHVRHFFSPDYIRTILNPRRFLTEGILSSCERLYGYDSALIEAVAAKI
ncbi:class I SAM-dependent methyltransferase [Micromonospora sp. NPDC047793]|uniref:class I SAM-dependent methyltransferase n=1 Tax=Micromonospora sp. NPDC047793 TaxID=3154342 RepID=UPI0033C32499